MRFDSPGVVADEARTDKQMIPAKIARVLGTEYGFQFTALSAEQRTRIRAALKAHPVIPYHGKGR